MWDSPDDQVDDAEVKDLFVGVVVGDLLLFFLDLPHQLFSLLNRDDTQRSSVREVMLSCYCRGSILGFAALSHLSFLLSDTTKAPPKISSILDSGARVWMKVSHRDLIRLPAGKGWS